MSHEQELTDDAAAEPLSEGLGDVISVDVIDGIGVLPIEEQVVELERLHDSLRTELDRAVAK